MAWLQSLTGKAENLLNKIDQKAANVLNEGTFKQNSVKKVLEDPEICVVPSETYKQNITQIADAKSYLIQPQPVPVEFSDSSTQETTTNFCEETESLDKNSFGSLGKNVVKDNSLSLEYDNALDDSKKALSISSKSESVLHSFSSAEDVQKYLERISKLEFESEDLGKQLLNIQHLYSELRNENSILKNNLERANELISTAQNEMEQYKARALKVLQEKEKMIKSGDELNELSEENVYITYNEELKNELKFQQSKNEELIEKISNLNTELVSLQQQYVVMQNMLQQTNQKTETNLFNERRMLSSMEDELKKKSKELNQHRQGLFQKNQELNEKCEEIEQLKSQLRQRSSIVTSDDVEARIKNLTQTLMAKQNKIETVTSERNALRIQLEKLENEYHKNLAVANNSQQKIIHVNDTDDVKLQIPQLMRVSPLDAGVTRRVKHAYSSLDALSIRTGVFLRRYPAVRIFVFSYMVLLHFWVLIILLNYAPSLK